MNWSQQPWVSLRAADSKTVLWLPCLSHICLICFMSLRVFQRTTFSVVCLMTKGCSTAMKLILKNQFLIRVYLDLQIHMGRKCCKRQRKMQLQVKEKCGSKYVLIGSGRQVLRDRTRKLAWRQTIKSLNVWWKSLDILF